MRGVSFVEDLEQYGQLPPDQQKKSKVRVTFFGREAETLVDLRAAQVVAAEKDIWLHEVLFLYFKMQAAMAVWPNSFVLLHGGVFVFDQ